MKERMQYDLLNKYILILKGSLKVSVVKINNWKNPSKKTKLKNYYLNEKKPQILFIPGGHAHGTQNLEKNTTFMVFSDFDINPPNGISDSENTSSILTSD